ncbi:MAG: hypothetical protein CMO80_07555 [Verrucomicrobiales bacterium]|nr:hypothetical protein [Verrucomicrobiales bacterium]
MSLNDINAILVVTLAGSFSLAAAIPDEPVAIGFEPQYFVDDHLVDNRWGNKQKSEMVLRRFHQPRKHGSPVIPDTGGYVCVQRDEATGRFKLWHQTSYSDLFDNGKIRKSYYATAYAESVDGLKWHLPKLGLHEWKGSKDNNVVWKGPTGVRSSGQQILTVPDRDRRGHRYIMVYRTGGNDPVNSGIRVIGSPDGIHWDRDSDTFLHLVHSDTNNGIVYDERAGRYVMFCRAKDRYRRSRGDMIDTGASRRISRMSHDQLWEAWPTKPRTILNPDALDAADNFNAFYGMPARYHAGIYWCTLWVFRFNDNIYTEFVSSRDGFHFERAPIRQPLIPLGDDGAWDDGMIFASPDWVEVGDEWWIYYAGWDGPHGTPHRNPGIGLARLRKGGFVSLRGPRNGGGVVTRQLIWPGGDLLVNCDAGDGELNVRISGDKRTPLPGFDYSDREPTTTDSTSQKITWGKKSMDELKGRTVRIEFSLRNADLYSFEARR